EWVRTRLDRIHPEALVQSRLQHLLQELRRRDHLPLVRRRRPERPHFLLGPVTGSLLLELPVGAEDVGGEDAERAGAEAIILRPAPDGEMQQLLPAVDVGVEYRAGPASPVLGRQPAQLGQQGPDLVEVRLGPQQGQLRVALGEVQAAQAKEIEDVPEGFAVAVDEVVAPPVGAGRPGPPEHGP
uniref:Uncharacterized protein n=1 Tax=Gopherus agassizii TaxID=38772 RepID=A0A452GNU5_9SAUR